MKWRNRDAIRRAHRGSRSGNALLNNDAYPLRRDRTYCERCESRSPADYMKPWPAGRTATARVATGQDYGCQTEHVSLNLARLKTKVAGNLVNAGTCSAELLKDLSQQLRGLAGAHTSWLASPIAHPRQVDTDAAVAPLGHKAKLIGAVSQSHGGNVPASLRYKDPLCRSVSEPLG